MKYPATVSAVLVFCTILEIVLGQTVTPAQPCTDEIRQDNCTLPLCRCSGVDTPGKLTSEKTPQLVFLTFDDAITLSNFEFYKDVFSNRRNPNGHNITVTFFVSHDYTNYYEVHELWRRGHEIALHSISHLSQTEYWKQLNETMWTLEFADQRQQMATFANIPVEDIKGMRAPFLQGGGDNMYKALSSNGFTWESSRPTLVYRNPGLWPYTNDYASTQDCPILPCHEGSYPGFWTIPMIDMMGDDGRGCTMTDSCLPVPQTEDDTYNLLSRNFQEHYNGNRAPFGIFTHAAWLNGTSDGDEIWQRRLGYIKFLDYLATLSDTYIVGISRALAWVKTPTSLDNLQDFSAFKTEEKPNQCVERSCCYNPNDGSGEKWFRSCTTQCPPNYPAFGNPLGQ